MEIDITRCARCERIIDGFHYRIKTGKREERIPICPRCADKHGIEPNENVSFSPGPSYKHGRWTLPKKKMPAWLMRQRGRRSHT